jgi:HEAT repeat protein
LTLLTGLGNVIGQGPGITDVVVTRDELLALDQAVVPIAGRGAHDPDIDVRLESLNALYQVAVSAADQIADPRSRAEFPPAGRRPSPEEQRFINQYRFEVAGERQELLPLLRAFEHLAPDFRRSLTDASTSVRLDACKTMIEIGLVRVRLQRRVASIPPFDNARLPEGQDPIFALYKAILPQLDDAVTDPALQIRLHAIESLEMLGPDAVLAETSLERALGDRNRFVRWSAIRSVGRLTPQEGEKIVPLLIPSLRDPDVDLRVMAMATLERYGAHARAALPALIHAVTVGDADPRRAAISAILAMGTDIAQPAIPTLTLALGDPQGTVRRAAAEALGAFGPAARDAIPGLERMEDSDEPEDRRAATTAILKILGEK